MDKIDLNREEINALIKLILYTKFENTEVESLIFSSSPIINSILSKAINIDNNNKDWERVFEKIPKTFKEVMVDKVNRAKIDNIEIMEATLLSYIFPYKND